ncbi:MAG TPA: hypothetical protein VF054_14065 [Micromonosporaceae bacterium]
MKRKIVAALLVAGTAVGGVALPMSSAFAAKDNWSCTTNGGGTPPGQQPTCTGGGLNNTNPGGNVPPGQNQ